MTRKTVNLITMSCLSVLLTGSSAFAQAKRPGSPVPKGKSEPQTARPAERPRSMPQTMEQRLQEAFGATEEQWKAFGPQVMKVNILVQRLEERGMPGMRGEREGRPGNAVGQQTPLRQAMATLQKLLADPTASPDAIKAQVATVRSERENIRKELQTARAELQTVLTEKQQAQAVLMGFLE